MARALQDRSRAQSRQACRAGGERRRPAPATAVARHRADPARAAAAVPARQPVVILAERSRLVAVGERHRAAAQLGRPRRRVAGRRAAVPDRLRRLPAAGHARRGRVDRAVRHGQRRRGEADLGPALRLVGIVGFLVVCHRAAVPARRRAADFSAGSGGILGRLGRQLAVQRLRPVGGNLFLLALLLVSVTLATGLSWLAVMDWIGQWVLAARRAVPPRHAAGRRMAAGARDARGARGSPQDRHRTARQARRRSRSSRRRRRRSRRATAPSANSRSRCSTSATAPASRRWRCSTIPSRSRRATTRTRSKRCRGRSNSSSRISASTRRWSAPIRAR